MLLLARRLFVILLLSVVAGSSATAQELSWRTLPEAPFTSRHNDAYFVTPDLGWIVNGAGEIHRTTDGGQSWARQLFQDDSHFRSVGFLDAERGFVGAVGEDEFGSEDPVVLYETADGGATWTPIDAFNGPKPGGLCGLQVVNDSTIVAVGRVRGPAFFVRSTDGGETWRSQDMADYAAGLIDVHFTHPDTGYAVGLTHVDHGSSSAVVLYTDDGGATWATRFTSTRTGEWAWKLSFPSRRVGYASLQRNNEAPIYFLKTTDGGVTWTEKLFRTEHYFVQGIGFIDEERGWIGGNSLYPVYTTADGGETWTPETVRPRINRFRFLGDSLGYAVGRTVHKLADWTATAAEDTPAAFTLELAAPAPNPFRDATTLQYTLDRAVAVDVAVYDLLGRRVRTLRVGLQPVGAHDLRWDGRDDAGQAVPAGFYLVRLQAGAQVQSRAVLHVR